MIHVSDYIVSLDRKEKSSTVDFISHAHSDHISSARSSKNVIASQETVELLDVVQGIKVKRDTTHRKEMKLLDAGHILGSKQIYVNDEIAGKRIVYTGDFQMQESKACKKIQTEQADVAIIDSTYFDPDIRFEERTDVESAMQLWVERKLQEGIILFGTYAVGKAQEIVSILNEQKIVPVVSKKVSVANRAYVNNGVKLDYASAYDNKGDYDQLLKGNFVGVVEMNNFDIVRSQLASLYNKPVYTAVATGWAMSADFGTDVQFPLSDHADFYQVKQYIDAVGAKEVFTYGSNAAILANNLKKSGYDAQPFTKGGRMVCNEVCCTIQV